MKKRYFHKSIYVISLLTASTSIALIFLDVILQVYTYPPALISISTSLFLIIFGSITIMSSRKIRNKKRMDVLLKENRFPISKKETSKKLYEILNENFRYVEEVSRNAVPRSTDIYNVGFGNKLKLNLIIINPCIRNCWYTFRKHQF